MKIRCKKCGSEIESHNYKLVWCKCGSIGIDGGDAYTRILFKDEKDYEVIE